MNSKERARNRWKLLANTVSKNNQDNVIIPSISYNLFNVESINTEWYKYSACIQGKEFAANICQFSLNVTPEKLMGFNNTGNVKIWPSEEILAYYVLSNLDLFRNKSIIELGGGMSCLAGIMAALYGQCNDVHLTDGNINSVYNVNRILEKNVFTSNVSCSVLKWNQKPASIRRYDVVLAADCLFFDEARDDLVRTISSILAYGGTALVAAPKRGNTLYEFIEMAQQEELHCVVQQNYNTIVWERHSKQVLYNKMTEFWKSTGKKYCDFCKCWIADNKPSIQFHENGKRHQNSVAKKLVDIKKNSAIQRKEEQSLEMDMKRMEQGAMKAYYNDIQNNPDYSSQVLIKERGITIRPTPYIATQSSGPVNISYSKTNPSMPISIKAVAPPKPTYVWHESRTEDGSMMYYWNTETGESVWEPPAEGFLSVVEQEAEEQRKKNKNKKTPNGPKVKKKKTEGEIQGGEEEDIEESAEPVRGEFEPFMAETTRIGSWKAVEQPKPLPVIDLQLPEQEFVAVKVPSIKEKEYTFKEKVVGNISVTDSSNKSSAEPISFKKAKFKKSNCRKRLDND
ncbi:WW domain-binding protein 4-like [Daktulosphaira vitifoliae]|uniref:WW domain-binding protein 4-like n=1 Tax=Daktulosphaira vitifoliae TaxID=58002 RepID=UPI0021A97B9A|nr:WW domain-binding protein 4-like [Daktulosphaira vitifoliae]